MTYKEISLFLENLNIGKSKREIFLKNHYPDILNEILKATKFLNETNKDDREITFAERVFCILHNIHERPKCIQCGSYVMFAKDRGCYREFCSQTCSRKSEQTKTKRKTTTLERYGSETFHNIEKAKKTRFEHNKGKWHSDDFSKKVKETKFGKYGDENWSNPEKTSKTNMGKYGVVYPFQSKEIRSRAVESFMKKHNGISCVFKLPSVMKKTHKGIRKRSYGFILEDKNITPNFTEEEYVNGSSETEFEFICSKCGSKFKSTWERGFCKRCPTCYPEPSGMSNAECELYEFLKNNCGSKWSVFHRTDINKNILNKREIDIVLKSVSGQYLCIEYDGLFYHSEENGKHTNYHLSKTEECEKSGIQLIHIFENEWISKQKIVESRLLNLLGIYENTVYARKCSIKTVDKDTKDRFLDQNHIQGKCSSSFNCGLYFENDLISLMTFGKSRFSKKYEWELIRFCNKTGYHVPGSAGKLLKFFEKTMKPKSIVSYADRRWSVGKLYYSLGFNLDHTSNPNYWYFKPNKPYVIYNRIGFQKHKLPKLLKEYDPKLSETKNMENNGYMRLWDCGNLVFVKTCT